MSSLLALDTSSSTTYVALRDSHGGFFKKTGFGTSHSESLASMVDQVISDSGLNSLHDISKIVLGSGPGSFTGLRIGYAFAKGLALGLSCECLEVSSLCAYAFEHLTPNKLVVSCADARRNELFASAYFWGEDSKMEVISPCIVSSERLLQSVQLLQENHKVQFADVVFVGDPFQRPLPFELKSSSKVGESLVKLAVDERSLGRIGSDLSKTGDRLADLAEIQPSYLRSVAAKTIAEREAEKRRG